MARPQKRAPRVIACAAPRRFFGCARCLLSFRLMSGWECRYQVDDRCLRLHRECKPGQPGCVLHGKVTFIRDLEAQAKPAKATATSKPAGTRRRKRKT